MKNEDSGLTVTETNELCPYCGEPLKVILAAIYNAENYGKNVIARSNCCHKPIQVVPIRTLKFIGSVTDNLCDDWGQPFAKEN